MTEPQTFKPDAFLEACFPGNSGEIHTLKECITRLNTQNDEVRAVLLLGESGVGKTYLAKVIAMHYCWVKELFLKADQKRPTSSEISDQKLWYVRAKGSGILKASGDPFREVPLPILEGDLARSWLFGHIKGAFTGATTDRKGFLGDEDVMSVLLDEVGYASLELQRNLLQVIQSGEFYKVGSTKKELTEARLLFATNQNLEELVRKDQFQEDLWWRLTDHVLYLPPLRERRNEIVTIANGILANLNAAHIGGDGSGFLHLTKTDLDWALAHDWHGNIRELEKTICRWFFYRGSRLLKEVWTQISPFIPRRHPPEAGCLQLNEKQLHAMFSEQLKTALAGQTSLSKPEQLLDYLTASTRNQAATILVACIDDLKLSASDLAGIFKDYQLSSLRSWMSRKRK